MFEQMLTIFFATGAAVAVILYAARPRNRVTPSMVSQATNIETYSAPEPVQVIAFTQVTAIEPPAVETAAALEEHIATDVAPAAAALPEVLDVAPFEPVVTATVEATPTATSEQESSTAVSVEAPTHTPERAHRVQRRRSSAASRGHTRSTKKAEDR